MSKYPKRLRTATVLVVVASRRFRAAQKAYRDGRIGSEALSRYRAQWAAAVDELVDASPGGLSFDDLAEDNGGE